MLTKQAFYDLQWGEFPELAHLLDKKELHSGWYGYSSQLNIMSRYLTITDIVNENEHEIKQAIENNIENNNGVQLHRDLVNLSRSLKELSSKFVQASHAIENLAYHCK
jgi:hypothetical protein